MDLLKEYCFAVCSIDGIDTYMISPVHYASLLAKQELLEELIPSWAKNWVMHFIPTAKNLMRCILLLGIIKEEPG